MIPEYNFYYGFYPFLPPNCDKPPTLYSVLNSIVNGEKDEDDYSKIKDLARLGRGVIFNFDYPLSDNINKEDFETLILNHYLMRRIGFETVTAFRIALDCKLNEIMPLFNKMFDALEGWDVFNDAGKTIRYGEDKDESKASNTLDTTSETNSFGTAKDSELPQSQISNIHNDSYLTNYGENTNNSKDKSNSSGSSTGESKKIYSETIERSPENKIEIMRELQSSIKSIYTMIFKELDLLFYSLL